MLKILCIRQLLLFTLKQPVSIQASQVLFEGCNESNHSELLLKHFMYICEKLEQWFMY